MKKLYLLLLCILCTATISGIGHAADFLPTLSDGRVWEILDSPSPMDYDEPSYIYSLSVDGDKTVDGIDCKVIKSIYKGKQSYFMAYESDGVIYVKHPNIDVNKFVAVIDYNTDADGSSAADVEEKSLGGIVRKCIHAGEGDYSYFIEGIGATDISALLAPYNFGEKPRQRILLRCYENGKLIYNKGEFTKGEHQFMPILTADRAWEMTDDFGPYKDWTSDYIVKVDKEETIAGVRIISLDMGTPKHPESRMQYEYAAYEEDGVFYLIDPEMPNELLTFIIMDFNIPENFCPCVSTMSSKVDCLEIDGITRKRYTFNWNSGSGRCFYWVEGIGSSGDYPVLYGHEKLAYLGYETYMKKCFEGDRQIFSREQFGDFGEVEELADRDNGQPGYNYYSLQGVRVKNPSKGSTVIRVSGNKAEKIIF